MPATVVSRRPRPLIPVAAVSAAALGFAVLLLLVRTQWSPLESVDRGTASDLNGLVSGHHMLVVVIKAVTWLGSDGVLWTVTMSAAVVLAIRRRWRLSAYLLVTGAGALVLDPVLKSLVGRLRPVVAHPVAHGLGNSFPSGHALGSIVCYGALMLVFVPAARGRWRTAPRWAAIALVVAIGASRLLLGVHYVSDVVGAWAVGVAWLGLTTFTFEVARWASGRPVTHPVDEGLEPEALRDLVPAEPEAPARRRRTHDAWVRHGRVVAAVVVAWVLIVGLLIGIGHVVVTYGGGNLLGDETIPRWFAAHRTSTSTASSSIASQLGATQAVLIVSLATCVVFLATTRRWRPVVYVAMLMLGELAAFLVSAAVVRRPRPDVPQLDQHLPTYAYPSGHEAATCCVYVALAILVIGHTQGRWRWLALVPAIAMPLIVAWSRLYRGEHHPTDLVASLIFAGLWVAATTLLIAPNRSPAAPLQRTASERPAEPSPSVAY